MIWRLSGLWRAFTGLCHDWKITLFGQHGEHDTTKRETGQHVD